MDLTGPFIVHKKVYYSVACLDFIEVAGHLKNITKFHLSRLTSLLILYESLTHERYLK